MKKIVVIGANEFQLPLVEKINELGYESHVVAWEEGAVAKNIAHKFYPVSITEKEQILEICKEINADAVLTAGSDLAVNTVNYVAKRMGLIGNSEECTLVSTNKYNMRQRFLHYNVPSPKFIKIIEGEDITDKLEFPVIVKPTDRSGSRGIMKVNEVGQLEEAIKNAMVESFNKEVLIEEYVEGNEYSVETISFEGEHQLLNITQKFTTGSPHFIETMHLQPAINKEINKEKIREITFKALNALGIRYGAAHTELKINPCGEIKIIEVGARMGGDYIGSHLVQLAIGYDFLKAIVDISLGDRPEKVNKQQEDFAIVKFILSQQDQEQLNVVKQKYKDFIYEIGEIEITNHDIMSSTDRYGHYILKINDKSLLNEILKVIINDD